MPVGRGLQAASSLLIAAALVVLAACADEREEIGGLKCAGDKRATAAIDYEGPVLGPAAPHDAVVAFVKTAAGARLPQDGYIAERTGKGFDFVHEANGQPDLRIHLQQGMGWGVVGYTACQSALTGR